MTKGKELRSTAIGKDQTKLYARVEALIEILEEKDIVEEKKVNEREEKLKKEMEKAGK